MLKALTLSELTNVLDARLISSDASFDGVSIDSRAITAGQLFIALTGPRFDGHDYLNDVAGKGAVAALVEREVADSTLPQLLVKDTRQALGQLGALNRAAFTQPVAAITGSSGKTTVKEMLASILRTRGPVLATRGNLNNDLGVPLTLKTVFQRLHLVVLDLDGGIGSANRFARGGGNARILQRLFVFAGDEAFARVDRADDGIVVAQQGVFHVQKGAMRLGQDGAMGFGIAA